MYTRGASGRHYIQYLIVHVNTRVTDSHARSLIHDLFTPNSRTRTHRHFIIPAHRFAHTHIHTHTHKCIHNPFTQIHILTDTHIFTSFILHSQRIFSHASHRSSQYVTSAYNMYRIHPIKRPGRLENYEREALIKSIKT
jgi:hypothetical protein